MGIYVLKQDESKGYDTYDSIVVAAESEDEARQIMPKEYYNWKDPSDTWARSPNNVQVTFLGIAKDGTKSGVILASFNAG